MDRVRHYNPNGTWGEYTTPSSDEDIPTRSTPNRGHDQNDHKEGEEGPPGEAIDTYEEEMRHMWALAREYKRAWTHLLRDFAAEGSLGHDIGEYYRDVIMNIAVDESQIPDSWYALSETTTAWFNALPIQKQIEYLLNDPAVSGDVPKMTEEELEAEREAASKERERTKKRANEDRHQDERVKNGQSVRYLLRR